MDQQENYQRDQKLDGELQVEKSPVMVWLDNFWYHYKWHVIVISFFVAVLVLCLVQILDRPKYDVNFVVAGTYRMNSHEVTEYNEVVNRLLPEDYDGNGEKTVNIMAYQIFSEADVAEEVSKAEAQSEEFLINAKFNADELNNFTQYTMTGDCSVFLLSPYLYQMLASEERLQPISAIYEGKDLPAGVTEDGLGVYINQTHFYQYNPDVQVMPEDMILCVLKPLVWGNNSSEAAYAKDVAFFCGLVDYQVKE